MDFLKKVQAFQCECPLREFGAFNRAQAMRNNLQMAFKAKFANNIGLQHKNANDKTDENNDLILNYRDMKPVVQKTLLYKDQDDNLAISEECLHKMFNGLARKNPDDPTEKMYLYESDLVKKLPT